MHERERGGGLQMMALVVATEAVVAREAGASPVTAREAVVARKDPVASTAAPRRWGRLRWRRRRMALVASISAGDGDEVGRR